MIIIKRPKITSLKVIYHMPDYVHLLQEFMWQYEDYSPKFPKTHRFLKYWNGNIDAVIKDVELAVSRRSGWQKVDFLIEK